MHLPKGFSFIHITRMNARQRPVFGTSDYEVNLLYIAGLLALALMGVGARCRWTPVRMGTTRIDAT